MRKTIIVVLCSFLFVGQALATDAVSKTAYEQARESGDRESAFKLAEKAYTSAWKGNADEETLAITAQNFGQAAIWINPSKAIDPIKQSIKLWEQGYGTNNLQLDELELIDSALAALSKPKKKKLRARLKANIDAYNAAGKPVTELSLLSQLLYTTLLFAINDFSESYEAATVLANKSGKPEDFNLDILTQANLTRVASISHDRISRMSNRSKLRDAEVMLDHTIKYYPKQADIGSFDKMLGQLLAWRFFVRGMMDTYRMDPDPLFRFEGQSPRGSIPNFLPQPVYCNVQWLKQPSPTYSGQASLDGQNGAVILGFDLNEKGQVVKTHEIGSVLGFRFTDKVREAVNKWQADPASLSPDCLKNHTTSWKFILLNP